MIFYWTTPLKSYVSTPKAKAKPSTYFHLDVNSLYGHSMMKSLPTEILDWGDPETWSR